MDDLVRLAGVTVSVLGLVVVAPQAWLELFGRTTARVIYLAEQAGLRRRDAHVVAGTINGSSAVGSPEIHAGYSLDLPDGTVDDKLEYLRDKIERLRDETWAGTKAIQKRMADYEAAATETTRRLDYLRTHIEIQGEAIRAEQDEVNVRGLPITALGILGTGLDEELGQLPWPVVVGVVDTALIIAVVSALRVWPWDRIRRR